MHYQGQLTVKVNPELVPALLNDFHREGLREGISLTIMTIVTIGGLLFAVGDARRRWQAAQVQAQAQRRDQTLLKDLL